MEGGRAQPGWSSLAENDAAIVASRSPAGREVRRFTVWRALIDLLAPVGYEDESGFNYGEQRREAAE